MPYNRLLVIDDEPDMAATVGKVARRAGFDTIITTDGADFLERAHSWQPTVMVLDLGMPGLGGQEILAELARQFCKARILIVSGYDRPTIDKAVAFGVDLGLEMAGVLQKPLRIEPLRAVLRTIFDDAELISIQDINTALKEGQFFLEYQPKVRLDTLHPVGVEALARWNHPQRGLIPPNSFIPIMETSGVMDRFTPHIIAMAVAQARSWLDQRIDLTMAINVSGGCVGRLRLDDLIAHHCAEQRIDPSRLTVEITETAAMGEMGQADGCLRRLKALGVGISIDDFGTGYSSLLQLHRLPLSELKIDRSFVAECDVNNESRIIVSTIINLAHSLGLGVVAEGIESQLTRDYLLNCKCNVGQGYFFSRPLSPTCIPTWIRDFERAPLTNSLRREPALESR
jgi:EAL domain-containing protein (putative c-di-GMP-specific phosphodiesterase class I)/AmiR/NasT family two-component response regulator